MSRIVPNENTWVGFSETVPTNLAAPTTAQITAAEDLTCFVVSINASSQGNTVPTPSICSLFETSIPGTSAAQFSADFYRDDEPDGDIAWDALPRATRGVFYISRFGGGGAAAMPIASDKVEVWPVIVTSRAAASLASNTAQTFTLTCAVSDIPAEDAVVAA
jgi:hypothetical protein